MIKKTAFRLYIFSHRIERYNSFPSSFQLFGLFFIYSKYIFISLLYFTRARVIPPHFYRTYQWTANEKKKRCSTHFRYVLALASLCQSGSGRKRRSKAFKFYQIRIFIRRLLLIYNHQASRSFLIPFLSRLFSTPANFKPSQLFSQLFSRLFFFFLFFLRFFLTLSRESVQILLCFVRIDKYFINSYEEKATMGKKQ